MEGKLYGVRKDYPFQINVILGTSMERIIVNNIDELLGVYKKLEEDPLSSKKKVNQLLNEMGIGNEEIGTRQMIDERTENILEEYLFYSKAPHDAPYNNNVWRTSVIILNSIVQNRLI